MSREKTQRIVLITGSNRGIGLETARQLARRGFHVIVAARDERKAQHVSDGILSAGGKATVLPVDVSRSDSIGEAARHFAAMGNHLDVLINNAGIYPDP